jgi:hypothetical protein
VTALETLIAGGALTAAGGIVTQVMTIIGRRSDQAHALKVLHLEHEQQNTARMAADQLQRYDTLFDALHEHLRTWDESLVDLDRAAKAWGTPDQEGISARLAATAEGAQAALEALRTALRRAEVVAGDEVQAGVESMEALTDDVRIALIQRWSDDFTLDDAAVDRARELRSELDESGRNVRRMMSREVRGEHPAT